MPRVLVIQDQPAGLRRIQSILTGREYQTIGANSIKGALRSLESGQTVDIIVADADMGGDDTFEMMRYLSHRKKLRDIPVILLTTNGDRDTVMRSIKSGARDILVKPVVEETLVEKIRRNLTEGGVKALIVSPEKLVQDYLAGLLQAEGFKPFTASSAQEGLAFLDEYEAKLVLSESTLPDMKGLELAEAIGDRFERLPVFLIGSKSNGAGDNDKPSPVAGYIRKPFQNTEIRQLFRDFMRTSQSLVGNKA